MRTGEDRAMHSPTHTYETPIIRRK